MGQRVQVEWTVNISEQFFAEHQLSTGSHPSYRHEEPASPTICVTLQTGGLLVRIHPEIHVIEGGSTRQPHRRKRHQIVIS
jgi:hypothetical protein